MNPQRADAGFTLIELMIAVTIVAILAAIAFPTYQAYTHRADRAAGKAALSAVSQNEEIYYGDHKSYGSVSTLTGGIASSEYVNSDGSLSTTQGSNTIYQISVSPLTGATPASCTAGTLSATPPDYLVIAAPLNFQLKDSSCMTLCLGSDGERGASGATTVQQVADCWAK